MKKHKKNQMSGITLIALVVTIIVLLILAGISIQMLTGDNGILQRAGEAKTRSDEAQIIERIRLAELAARTDGNGYLNYTKLKSEMTKEFGTEGTDWTISDLYDNPWVINVKGVSYNVLHEDVIVSSTSAEWEVSGNKLISYLGTSKNIIIPNYVDNISTTIIGENIFKNSNIESLKIPKGITTIENSAFENCINLSGDLIIPDSVTTIGNTAFSKCSNLTGKLVLPNSVITIGGGVFQNDRFTNLELDLTTINPGLFTDNTELKGSIKFGKNVKTIATASFQNCSGLTGNLIIPDNVETIEYVAFMNCTGLTGTIKLGKNVKRIYYGAFQNCSGLTGDLIIPDSVQEIQNAAFQNCICLTGKLYLGSGITSIASNEHGTSPFVGDTFNDVEINMSNIPFAMFQETSWSSDKKCTLKGTLTLGNNVKTIGKCAFQGCSGLTGDLIIPDNVTSMDWAIFQYCSGFNGNLYISNNINSILDSTFEDCVNIKKITNFGNNITYIGSFVFENCSGIEGDIILPNSLSTIDQGAFTLCTGMNSITVPNSVNSIKDYAFDNVKKIYYSGTASGSPWGALSIE